MKVLLDTSAIVEIDRKNKLMIDIIKELISKNVDLYVSIETVSEILTGCYLREDFEKASAEAKRVLSQFLWIDIDSKIAERTAQFMAYLIKKGKIIEYPDVVIAATFDVISGDYILTLNKSHFESIPEIKGKVVNVRELRVKV